VSSYAPRRTVDLIDRRVGLVFGVLLLLLGLAAGRAVYLGTFRSQALQHAGATEHVDSVTIPAVRGEITDRNGVPLALSEAGDQIIVDPYLIGKSKESAGKVAAQLAPLVGLTKTGVQAAFDKPHTGYVVLSSYVPAATAARIMSDVTNYGIDGISEAQAEKRVYPRDDEAAQILGWIGSSGGNGDGLEYTFNKQLQGTSGRERIVNDALGKPIQVTTEKQMTPGQNLKLTISAPLQAEVEQILAGVGKKYAPKGATAIVTDPQTDQILAVASWPSFNANDVTSSDLQSIDGDLPAVEDQAVDFSYEPGSTFKAITVSGALQDGVVTPNTEITVPPYLIDPAGQKINDAENHGYEDLSVAGILKVSSNIGADLIGQRLGADRFGYWVSRFGFGRPTGVALAGEQQGEVLPVSQYTSGSMYNLPFGQGEGVTPMQMVQAYDAIADGGILRTPQIVDSLGGKTVPEPKGKRIISAKVASEMRGMLRGVMTDGGTASGAAIAGYDLAGKTGTAQIVVNGKYSNKLFVASFIGMVPASDPKLVVAVIVDEPTQNSVYGGSVAGPAFQSIVGWAVPYFGINPCPVTCPKAGATEPDSL